MKKRANFLLHLLWAVSFSFDKLEILLRRKSPAKQRPEEKKEQEAVFEAPKEAAVGQN